ncbi:hypothetical protein [Lysobacter claricitrinus]|uniref:hypothetical protein n=1 Tax=Lysobacter claricitrinus TaxID=3367728 RepID=UPI0037DBC503
MTPALPTDAIRTCIANNDFDGAHALLVEHENALRATFDTGTDAEKSCRESWLQLLAAQRGLIDELRAARDDAARSLERLGRDSRAVKAYLQDAG